MPKSVKFALGGTLTIIEADDERAGCRITTRIGAVTITTEGNHVMYTLPVNYGVAVKVSYVDAGGNPAEVDGDIDWASSDESVASVVVNADDTTQAAIQAHGKIGSAQITATADADIGEGVRELITILDVGVIAGEAVAGTITPQGDATPNTSQPTA